jgi:hypothetical protein
MRSVTDDYLNGVPQDELGKIISEIKNNKYAALVITLRVAGHFAERHFAERHFAERHSAERIFCRRTFCRTDVLPKGHFAERTFCRTDSLTNGQLAENRDIF